MHRFIGVASSLLQTAAAALECMVHLPAQQHLPPHAFWGLWGKKQLRAGLWVSSMAVLTTFEPVSFAPVAKADGVITAGSVPVAPSWQQGWGVTPLLWRCGGCTWPRRAPYPATALPCPTSLAACPWSGKIQLQQLSSSVLPLRSSSPGWACPFPFLAPV